MAKKSEVKQVVMPDPVKMEDKKRCLVTGSKNADFSNTLLNQAVNTMWIKHTDEATIDKQMTAVMIGMMGASPQDEVEAMLAAQMVAAHNASMECFRRAMIPEQTVDGRAMNLSHAGKLSRTYATMLEALQKYRGGTQQKILVQHVNVESGAQAVIGNVNHPGGGAQPKTEEQPHAKQAEDAPMQEMPSQNPQGELVSVTSNA